MEFVIQKENVYNCLSTVIRATAVRGIQPVLGNVLIESNENNTVKFAATDLDLSIVINSPATVSNIGSVTLPAKKLMEIVSKLPEKPVKFSTNPENNLTTITCEKAKFDLIGIPASEFPNIIYPESGESIDIEVEPLLKAIKQTVFAAAVYDTNNVLSGVFCSIKDKKLEMAATDGNRLSRAVETITNKDGKEYSVVIPSRTLSEFSKISSGKTVSITIKGGEILFKFNDRFLSSRLLEGQYPKYQQLIPRNHETVAVVNREALIASLDRTATMVNERTSIVKLSFVNDQLKLSADTPDLGDSSDVIEVEYTGEEFNIAFNYKYILDSLRIMDSEKVKIELNTPLSATLFKPDSEEDYLCLVMPVQIR